MMITRRIGIFISKIRLGSSGIDSEPGDGQPAAPWNVPD